MKQLLQESKYDEISLDGLITLLTSMQSAGDETLQSFVITTKTKEEATRSYTGSLKSFNSKFQESNVTE